MFDLRKMQTIYTLSDNVIPQYCESSISLSSDKKYIAIGSTKGQIYVINTQLGEVSRMTLNIFLINSWKKLLIINRLLLLWQFNGGRIIVNFT